ncbi:unnamed protein product [Meganyctiphanes norvegica]|uniref:Uncharacterized protein n=1 Tax=Meganyctiphanes norvegica TaxID=48144 RepID=A0AAV2QRF5_MEGNR
MAETDYDMKSLFQKIYSVDNDKDIRSLFLKLEKMPHKTFFKLVNEHLNLIFSTRDCDDSFMNMDILFNPENLSDQYIRLGFICFIRISSQYKNHYDFFMMENFYITISQIVVDKYIPYVEGQLFNSHILISLINMMHDYYTFSCNKTRSDMAHIARKLNKDENDLLDKFYANLIDLLAQLILIEIKFMKFGNISDILLVSNAIVKFFDIYYEISEYIEENHPACPPFIEKSVMSSMAVITNCILLFQAKLLASDIHSSNWSNMICRMEKLRDYMANFEGSFFQMPLQTGASLQRFLTEREHGSFNTNCAKKLYNVTNDISQIDVCERSTDITVRSFLQIFKYHLNHLMHHVNSICYRFNIKHRVISKLYAFDERFTLNRIEDMNDLISSDGSEVSNSETDRETDGSEVSNSETDRETVYMYSDDEISTDGNEGSDSETN